jgi:hypothetical protein
MSIACLIQAGKLLQAISVDRRTRCDGLLDECQQREQEFVKVRLFREPTGVEPPDVLRPRVADA